LWKAVVYYVLYNAMTNGYISNTAEMSRLIRGTFVVTRFEWNTSTLEQCIEC